MTFQLKSHPLALAVLATDFSVGASFLMWEHFQPVARSLTNVVATAFYLFKAALQGVILKQGVSHSLSASMISIGTL